MTRKITFCALGAVIMLSGCTALGVGTADKLIQRTPLGQYFGAPTNLVEKSYAAADYLAHQLQKQGVDLGETIYMTRLQNTASPEIPTQFDYIIPEAVGERLAQLGYGADLSAVSVKDTGQNNRNPASLAFMGHYKKEKEYYRMSTKIIQIKDNTQIAAFNYMIPRSWEIDKLITPEEPEEEAQSTTEQSAEAEAESTAP